MSNDLVKRLRESGTRSEVELHEDREEAADRIEELESKLKVCMIALTQIAFRREHRDAFSRTALEALLKLEGE